MRWRVCPLQSGAQTPGVPHCEPPGAAHACAGPSQEALQWRSLAGKLPQPAHRRVREEGGAVRGSCSGNAFARHSQARLHTELPHLLVCFLLEHTRQHSRHSVRLGLACRRQTGAEQAPRSTCTPSALQLHSSQQAHNCATGTARGERLRLDASSKLSNVKMTVSG